MRNYLILVENRNQMKFILDKFNTIDYNVKKDVWSDNYYITKRDETVRYDILLAGRQHDYYRGRRWNGVIRCCYVSNKEMWDNIIPYLIEQYYDKNDKKHCLPCVDLECTYDEVFENAIRLVENYDK